MLQPSRTKYTKEMKGRSRGYATRGNTISVGEYALQSLEATRLTGNQIESARKVIVRVTARKGKLWLRAFPQKPITKKPAEVRMGSGKGAVDHFVAIIKPGKILFELGGVSKEIAELAFTKASRKLPVKTRVISIK